MKLQRRYPIFDSESGRFYSLQVKAMDEPPREVTLAWV